MRPPSLRAASAAGAQFTCFTTTKVQILTQTTLWQGSGLCACRSPSSKASAKVQILTQKFFFFGRGLAGVRTASCRIDMGRWRASLLTTSLCPPAYKPRDYYGLALPGNKFLSLKLVIKCEIDFCILMPGSGPDLFFFQWVSCGRNFQVVNVSVKNGELRTPVDPHTEIGAEQTIEDVRGVEQTKYADVCWRMLTYAGVCWRILTYPDVY
jgi:hypothetical protein